MFKKAQAAMEFLMTYGWAILVVLAAIGALAYFGVLSPANLLPTKCEFPAGLDCTEHPDGNSAAGGTLTFPVVNSLGYDITVTAATSTGTAGCSGALTGAPLVIANGASGILALTTCGGLVAGDRFKDEVTIMYTSSKTLMTHSANGQVAGKAR